MNCIPESDDLQGPNGLWTSLDLVPIVSHPDVAAEGTHVVQTILGLSAYRNQTFTEQLEDLVIVPVAQDITRRKLRFEYSNIVVDGAALICVDELLHADCARQLGLRIGNYLDRLNINIKLPIIFPFVDNILQYRDKDSDESILFKNGNVFVSETLITKSLIKMKMDVSLDSKVHAFAKMHFNDEARHHAFFARFLSTIWPQMSFEAQAYFGGVVIPDAITRYLAIDKIGFYQDLAAVGFSNSTAERIIEETYSSEYIKSSVIESSKQTLLHMRRAGMFNHPSVMEGIARNNII